MLRGVALFGVLLVNLLGFFRVSLFEHASRFHTHPGALNHAVDITVAALLEFKAFALFSLAFGMGVAVQADRGSGVGFFIRRFGVLLLIGLAHLLLVSNVDILALYAVCGLLLLPFLRAPAAVLLAAGTLVYLLRGSLSIGPALPPFGEWTAHAQRATGVYTGNGYGEVLAFRMEETRRWILPLLTGVAPRTCALMLIGMAFWRSGSYRRTRLLRVLLGFGLALGIPLTWMGVAAAARGASASLPDGDVPLAVAYGAAIFLYAGRRMHWLFAAAGRMALTNYLTQSIVFAWVFYGWGLGLMGKLGPASAVLMGMALYAVQIASSRRWLARFRLGPAEWLWRSLTYGRVQPMRREAHAL